MTLTTQHLEELLRLALTENARLAAELLNEKNHRALQGLEVDRLKREAQANAGRLYMDPDERKALARDVSDAHIRLAQTADVLRWRSKRAAYDAGLLSEKLHEWAKKLRVST